MRSNRSPPSTATTVSTRRPTRPDRGMDDAATADTGPPIDRSRQALWAALGLIVLWGANFSVQKAVFQALSPGGFLFIR